MWHSYFFQITLGELYENYHHRADFSFKLRIMRVFDITTEICMNFPPWDLSSNKNTNYHAISNYRVSN
jgi:hypothetical protein